MKKIISICFLWLIASAVFAQNVLVYSGNHNYTLVERTNLRRYDNDKYTGLMSREVRSFITCENNRNGDFYYSGDFYVSQDTVRNQKVMFTGIHEAIPSSFIINERGNLTMKVDNGYPTFRSFPSFPRDPVKIGDTWKGDSFRAIDPLNNGIVTKIPMTVLYKLLGEEVYKGEPVYRISAEWATRYGISYFDYKGDENLKSAQGSHKAVVLVSKRTGASVFMTDEVDEVFIYKDGTKAAFKGTILQFTEYPPSTDYDKILPALKRIGAVAKADTGNKSNDGKQQTAAAKSNGGKQQTATGKSNGGNQRAATGKSNNGNQQTATAKSNGGNQQTATDKSKGSNQQVATNKAKGDNSQTAPDGKAKSSGQNPASQTASTGLGSESSKPLVAKTDRDENKGDYSLWREGGGKTAETPNKTTEKSNVSEGTQGKMESNPAKQDNDAQKQESESIPKEEKVPKQKITEVLASPQDPDDLGENKITVEETDGGIKLSIHDLKFKADSSELLPGESKRLDEIAGILKLVPDSMLLVEGHTADTGYPAGEMMLSKERAFRIANELSKRGINSDKFICKGSGATKPIADNKTAEGMAKNRRVEITILE